MAAQQFTLGSDITFVTPKTFNLLSDITFVAPKTFTLSSDVKFVTVPPSTLNSDVVFTPPQTVTLNSDITFVPPVQFSLLSDITFVAPQQFTLSSDIVFVGPGITFTLTSDVVFVSPEPLPTGVPNPQRPCPAVLKDCECQEDPISNYSSEDPDPALFCAVATYTQTNPTLGQCGGQGSGDLSATEFCCSDISQEDAYLCALRKAQEKVLGGSP